MMIISAVGFQTSEYVVTPFSVVAFTPHLPLLPSYFSTAASAAETDGLPVAVPVTVGYERVRTY